MAGAKRGRQRQYGPQLGRDVLGVLEQVREAVENVRYTVLSMTALAELVRSGQATPAQREAFWRRFEAIPEIGRREHMALRGLCERPVTGKGQILLPLGR